jgi:hypothetical protein
VIYDTIL